MSRIAVIGAGIGGMTAAGELAHAGHRVTLFEQSPTLGGKAQVVSAHGVTLDTGPTLLTMPDVVRGTFARMGAFDLLPRFISLPHQARYQWADGCTFDCHAELEATVESADGIRSSEAKGIRSFYREAAAIHRAAGEPYLEAEFDGLPGFLARVARRGLKSMLSGLTLSTLDSLAKKHFRTSHMHQFVGRFATYAGASPYQASAAFALIPHIEREFGVHHVEGGMVALVAALGTALARLGVDIQLGVKAGWNPRGGRLFAGRPFDEQPFDAVVVNADPLASRPAGTGPLALSGYVLLLEVSRRLKLPHHTVAFGDDYPREFSQLFGGAVPTDPTVYFCHPAASDPTMAPLGKSGVFAMVNAPALAQAPEPGAWDMHAAVLRERCLAVLRRVAPEIRGGDITVLGERTPVDLLARGAPGGSIYGFLPHGRLGPFRRPRIRTATPGVFYAGGGTHPGGGVPLVMLSGRFAAELALAHVGGAA